jgi:hypothetical protein
MSGRFENGETAVQYCTTNTEVARCYGRTVCKQGLAYTG